MTSFEPELYGSETKFPLFPRNLESFTAPSLKKTVPDMFKASPKISRIMLNAAEEIAPYTFRGCRGAKFVLATLGNDAGMYGGACAIMND